MHCLIDVLCIDVAGFDDVFTVNSADGSAKVDQHTGSRNAACM